MKKETWAWVGQAYTIIAVDRLLYSYDVLGIGPPTVGHATVAGACALFCLIMWARK